MNLHSAPNSARRFGLLILFLALAISASISRKSSKPDLDRLRPIPAESDEIEHVEKRAEWFEFQRAYPFGSIPPNARRNAWASRPGDFSTQKTASEVASNWLPLGPMPTRSGFPSNWGVTSGRITSIAISPANPQLVLIGAAVGGIWRSTDGGSTFIPVTDDQVDLAVGSIAFSERDPSIVYAGMGDTEGYLGSGVLKSTDGGEHWTRVNNGTLPATGTTSSIKVDPTDPNRVYLAQFSRRIGSTVFSSGLFISTDGGITWSVSQIGLVSDLAISRSNPQTVYLATARVDMPGQPPAGLYRSTDGGDSWTNIFATPYDPQRTRDVRVAVASEEVIYVYTGGFIGSRFDVRVVMTTDGGATWTNRGSSNLDTGQFGYNTYIAVQPDDSRSIYVGTRDLFKSPNRGSSYVNLTKNLTPAGGGFSFDPENSNTHIDQHVLAFAPGDPNVIYIGNDGGLSKSTNGGTTFSSLNSSLSLTQAYGITIDPSEPAISYIGTQDNGMQRRAGDPLQWNEMITGDFRSIIVNPLDPSSIVTNFVFGTIVRFNDRGDDFDRQVASDETFGESAADPRIDFLAPLTGTGVDSKLLFGTWRLFVSPDFGNTWRAPAGTLDLTRGVTSFGPDVLSAIGVGRSNPNVIYTGSAQGRAMVTTDGGSTWADITPGLPNRSITEITVDPRDSAVAYICLSGFGAGHVFKTANTGVTWTNESGNLPDIPVNALAFDPLDANTIYAGTDVGVFRSSTAGGDWLSFNDGLPPVVVRAFATDPIGLLQAATFGRGVYQLGSPSLPLPVVTAVTAQGKKNLRIVGTHFGLNARVRINDVDRSNFATASSPQLITLKGKPKKLGLVTGTNNIQVISSVGSSNVFVLLR